MEFNSQNLTTGPSAPSGRGGFRFQGPRRGPLRGPRACQAPSYIKTIQAFLHIPATKHPYSLLYITIAPCSSGNSVHSRRSGGTIAMLQYQHPLWGKRINKTLGKASSFHQLKGTITATRSLQVASSNADSWLGGSGWQLGGQFSHHKNSGVGWLPQAAFIFGGNQRLTSKGAKGTPVGNDCVGSAASATAELQISALVSDISDDKNFFALKTSEEVSLMSTAISAAQEAAVLPLKVSTKAHISQSEIRAAISTVQRLQKSRHQLERRGRMLQRLHLDSDFPHESHSIKETLPIADSPAPTDESSCRLPVTVISTLNATSDRIAASVDAIPVRRLLFLSFDLAKLGCCTAALADAVVQRVAMRTSCLSSYDVALGVQVTALLLKQAAQRVYHLRNKSLPHEAQDLRHTGGSTRSQLEIVDDKPIGRRTRRVFPSASIAGGWAPPGHVGRDAVPVSSMEMVDEGDLVVSGLSDDAKLQRSCLFAINRLLDKLVENRNIRAELPLRMCVRTADACAQLVRHRPPHPELRASPAAFVAAVTAVVHPVPSLGRTGSVADVVPIAAKPHTDELLQSTNQFAPNTQRTGCAVRTKGAAQRPLASSVASSDANAASQVITAALWRRLQQRVAPRVVALLLDEASDRRDRLGTEPHGSDPGWSDELMGIAVTAAAKGVSTNSTSKKLLLQLLRGLQCWHSQVLQQQSLPRPDSRKTAATEEPQKGMERADLGADCQRAARGMTPSALASVCYALATSGVSIREPTLTFLLGVIRASLEGLIASETTISSRSVSPITQPLSGRSDGPPASSITVGSPSLPGAPPCSEKDGRTTSTRNAQGGVPTHSYYSSQMAAFYGEWCVVLWAGAKLLKAAASKVPAENPVIVEGQRLLVTKLLGELTARLPVAEPTDVAQIAGALRLFLLMELKAKPSTQPALPQYHDARVPLLVRQRLLPASEFVLTLQSIGGHLVRYSKRFEVLEVMECLRLFVQLDLLHYLDIEVEDKGGIADSHMDAYGQSSGRQHSVSFLREHTPIPTPTGAGVLRAALTRLVQVDTQHRFEFAVRAETRCHQRKKLPGDYHLKHSGHSCEAYVHSVFQTVALKYPDELQRLPSAVRRAVLKHSGMHQFMT